MNGIKKAILAGTIAATMAGTASAQLTATPVVPDLDIVLPTFELFDAKTIPGLACQPYYGSQSGDFNHYVSGIYNASNGYRRVSCPIVRDNTSNTTGTFGVDNVYVYATKPAGNLTCYLYSYTNHAGFVASDADSTAAVGNVTLQLDVNSSANTGFYAVYCYMPPNSTIRSLKWLEPLRTDRNN